MDCTNCELPIVVNRYDNAITIDRRGWRVEVLHFECVDDPTQLHPEQFQKWAAWRMKHEREEREAHQEKVAADLQVIHRARHALPQNLNHEYIDELYGEPEPSKLDGVPPVCYCAACERPLFCSGELDRNCRLVMVDTPTVAPLAERREEANIAMTIPTDAIAIVTPHGRYERVLRNRKEALPCGHRTAMDEIAWQRDTKTPGDGELPSPMCNACMIAYVEAFVAAGHQEAA